MFEPPLLNAAEQRVMGVLIEKSLATPQYYPLTLNQVVTACNQKSNRDPVMSLMEDEVVGVLNTLANRGLATQVFASGSRAGKYRQELTGMLELNGQEMAVLAEFLLRGAQTVGELRTRASRMKSIPDMAALNEVLQGLAGKDQPLARRLTPPGIQRGVRWGHLLQDAALLDAMVEKAPESTTSATSTPATSISATSISSPPPQPSSDRLSQLEEKLDALEKRIAQLENSQRL